MDSSCFADFDFHQHDNAWSNEPKGGGRDVHPPLLLFVTPLLSVPLNTDGTRCHDKVAVGSTQVPCAMTKVFMNSTNQVMPVMRVVDPPARQVRQLQVSFRPCPMHMYQEHVFHPLHGCLDLVSASTARCWGILLSCMGILVALRHSYSPDFYTACNSAQCGPEPVPSYQLPLCSNRVSFSSHSSHAVAGAPTMACSKLQSTVLCMCCH
jgi:hypothetical protein